MHRGEQDTDVFGFGTSLYNTWPNDRRAVSFQGRHCRRYAGSSPNKQFVRRKSVDGPWQEIRYDRPESYKRIDMDFSALMTIRHQRKVDLVCPVTWSMPWPASHGINKKSES